MNKSYDMGYKRVTGVTRCNNFRGFRLNIRKLSIRRLRIRFMHFFKMLFRWRKSYEHAVKSLKKGICSKSSSKKSIGNYNSTTYHSRSRLIKGGERIKPAECRLRSLGRTNSFYTEAIADCLEFIKRNSVSSDDSKDEAVPLSPAVVR